METWQPPESATTSGGSLGFDLFLFEFVFLSELIVPRGAIFLVGHAWRHSGVRLDRSIGYRTPVEFETSKEQVRAA